MDSVWRCIVAALYDIILAQQLTITALRQEIKAMRRKQGNS